MRIFPDGFFPERGTFFLQLIIGIFSLIGWVCLAFGAGWIYVLYLKTLEAAQGIDAVAFFALTLPAVGLMVFGIFVIAQAQLLEVIRRIERNTRPQAGKG